MYYHDRHATPSAICDICPVACVCREIVGRESQTNELLEILETPVQRQDNSSVVVIGGHGFGKSIVNCPLFFMIFFFLLLLFFLFTFLFQVIRTLYKNIKK